MTQPIDGAPANARALLASWAIPIDAAPTHEVYGTDATLALEVHEALKRSAGQPVITFHPTRSDLAQAIGLPAGETAFDPTAEDPTRAVQLDLLCDPTLGLAVNHVVFGTAPDFLGWGTSNASFVVEIDGKRVFSGRASTVLIANGQFVRGHDVIPKGHPADGIAEVQIYRLRRSERRKFRERLQLGEHLPHPRIFEGAGKNISVRVKGRAFPLEADGSSWGTGSSIELEIKPHAYCLALP